MFDDFFADGSLSDLVHPGIRIGGISAVEDHVHLRSAGVRSIVNMTGDVHYSDSAVPSCKVYRAMIDDCTPTAEGVLPKAAELIDHALNTDPAVLVHCTMGISRSTAAVLSYLMIYEDIGWESGLRSIQAVRRCANPHPQLKYSLIRDLGDRFLA